MKKIIVFMSMAGALAFFLGLADQSIIGCASAYTTGTRSSATETEPAPLPPPPETGTTIRVAILLDASNSMDGLIDQAKSRLWNIVNTLTTLKYGGQTPGIRIALYMYGNDGLSREGNYIKQVAPFTGDLDLVSEKLFSIATRGGSEYCGAVIDDAVKKLDWGNEPSDMKLIYIAGNEPFNQGPVNYKESVSGAVGKQIFVNTIHCGDCNTGIDEFWKDGAVRGKGKYFCINSDEVVSFIETPYDAQIDEYNVKLNDTYIYYGSQGTYGMNKRNAQDANAAKVSKSNNTERIVSKSKSVYKNESWDLVDKGVADSTYVKQVDKKTLAKEYQALSADELNALLRKKSLERAAIQKEIGLLAKKRQEYIKEETQKTQATDDFGYVVNASVIELARLKGYTVDAE